MNHLDEADIENYWPSFLQMLSVERVEPYVEELELPFERAQFPGVMRLARACLEVDIFSTGETATRNPERASFVAAWHAYRQAGGVLGEEELARMYRGLGEDRRRTTYLIFLQLEGRIGRELSAALRQWFTENHPRYLDDTWRWPWAIKHLCNSNLPATISPATPAPLSPPDMQKVRRFSERYEAHKEELEMRMFRGAESARVSGPTPWERVLQTFPADSEGATDYPWLDTIAGCLQRLLVAREWGALSDSLGPRATAELVNWVRSHEPLLPNNPTLPDPPRLTRINETHSKSYPDPN